MKTKSSFSLAVTFALSLSVLDARAEEVVLAAQVEALVAAEEAAPLVMSDEKLPVSASLSRVSEGEWLITLKNNTRTEVRADIRLEQLTSDNRRISASPYAFDLAPGESATRRAARDEDAAKTRVVLTDLKQGNGQSPEDREASDQTRTASRPPEGERRAAASPGEAEPRARFDVDRRDATTEILPRTPDFDVGDRIIVTGKVVAGSTTLGGEVREVLITDGERDFQVSNQETREDLYRAVGERVKLEGTVESIELESIRLKVNRTTFLDRDNRDTADAEGGR